MDPNDPNRDEWGARLTTVTYSLTEGKIQFDVLAGTRNKDDLVRFYDAHLKTLDPGSSEYRRVITLRDNATKIDFNNEKARLALRHPEQHPQHPRAATVAGGGGAAAAAAAAAAGGGGAAAAGGGGALARGGAAALVVMARSHLRRTGRADRSARPGLPP